MNTTVSANEYHSFSQKDQFLIRCAKISKGNTHMGIRMDAVTEKYSKDQSVVKTINDFITEGFIRKLTEKKEIFLTRKAFYHVIHITKEDPTTYGMVSYREAKELSIEVLKSLCVHGRTKLDTFRIGQYGGEVAHQVIDILHDENLILFDHETMVVTDKGRLHVLAHFLKKSFDKSNSKFFCCVELLDGTDGTLTIDMQNRFSDLFS